MRLPFTTLLLAALGLVGFRQQAQAQTVYGLSTTNIAPGVVNLVTFQITAPGTFTTTVPVTGLGAGQTLVGMDSRPNTGQLFALGYNPTGTQAQLYTLNTTTGALTTVGSAITLNLGTNTNRIGFDFNPMVDRIRVTGNTTNFRLNPNNGAVAAIDGNLAYATGSQMQGVGAVAYTNSYIGATATTLFDIDEANSSLAIQNPPNNGTLTTVGPLGITTAGAPIVGTDLDIYFNPTNNSNTAYLVVANSGGGAPLNSTQLYTVNTGTGATTAMGSVGPSNAMVTDIAFQITRTVPATVAGQLVYALAGTNLLTFDSSLPSIIRTSTGITGVDAAQTLVGLDVRPATNRLFALGYNATAQNYQLYTINAATGLAVPINTTPIALALGTGKVSFDFNPMVDRIRVVGANRTNFRLNPNDGTVAFTDAQLTYATGDVNASAMPNIGAVAYTNSVNGPAATATTLYNYDMSLNILATQAAPNTGVLSTVGSSTIMVNATAPNLDLDIYSSAAGTNTAYLVANTGTNTNSSLYLVNLTSGAATQVGPIGNGIAARDIAVAAATGVASTTRDRAELATALSLYPNPTAGTTSLHFSLPRPSQVALSVFDALGRQVSAQPATQLAAGANTLSWEARGQRAGLYFVRLSVDGQVAATRQVVVQ